MLSALTLAVLWSGRRYAVFGWLFYLGTLVPMSGLVQAGLQGRADRYTYVPLIGIFVAVACGVQELVARTRSAWVRRAAAAAGVASVAALAAVAWLQVGTWRDSVTLFEHGLRVAPSAPIHNNLGAGVQRPGTI